MHTPQERWDNVFLSGKDFTLINELFLDRVLQEASLVPSPEKQLTALDVGCGTGDLLVKLADRGFSVDGVDASSVALEEAERRLGDRAGKLLHLDIDRDKLDGTDTHYDLVVMKLVLAFTERKDVILDVIAKKIAHDGVFLLITPILNDTMSMITPKAQAISITEDEVESLLNKHFGTWELFHKELTREQITRATYLARAN